MAFAPRPHFDWRLRTRSLPLGEHTIVMGILNVTPDSFSDGGHFYSPQNAPERAPAEPMKMLAAGAQILDVGGESTRPNATPLTPDEEQARILPVVESILKQRPKTILSIDTFHASTAQHAIEAGAEIINDVSGHLWDASMSTTCATLGCGTVLMHTRGRPQEWPTLPPLAPGEALPVVLSGLAERLEETYPLLAYLDQLQRFNLPILVGASRKSFLGHTRTTQSALDTALHPP